MNYSNYRHQIVQITKDEYSIEGSFWKHPFLILVHVDNDFCKFDFWEEEYLENILQKSCFDSFLKRAKQEGGVN